MSEVISISDKTTIPIPGGGVNGAWNTQSFAGQTSFSIDWNGRATVHFQYRIILDDDELLWPTWREIRVLRQGGEADTGDETITIPRKKSQAGLYTVEMDVDPAIPLSIQFRHDGDTSVKRVKGILKIAPKVTEVVAR